MGIRSYHVTIDDVPYLFKGTGIQIGDALTEPAPPLELGFAVVENVSEGLGPRISRGNGYHDIHRLIPIVEGQLIFLPQADVGAAFALTGSHDYTQGAYHHPCSAGQYIAFGTRIYRVDLTDFAGLTYTLVVGSDCTSAPISNVNARYTGGAFVWRDRIYFGIENGLNGQAVGYAWIDFVADTATATVVNDATKGFSYAAANRGRLFLAQNQAPPEGIRLKWSPDMATDFSDAAFDLFGDSGTFVYGIETRPRVSWVLMVGSAALFFREDGSVLSSDEAGFIGITSPRSQSSGSIDRTQGFGAVHYLDGAAYPVFAGGPHHINPVNLVTRSLSPGNAQDLTVEDEDTNIRVLSAVGEHLIMGGDNYLYVVVWRTPNPVVHKIMNLNTLAGSGYKISGISQQSGLIMATMYNSTTGHFKQIHMDLLPNMRVSEEVYSGAALQGWVEPGVLVGPQRAATMTKLWLQVRAAFYTRIGASSTLTFTSALVDESKSVSIASVSSAGPVAAAISATPETNRLGRTLSYRLNMNVTEYTGFNERLFTPLIADFLWAPTVQDKLTLQLAITSEQATLAGGVRTRTGARAGIDALMAKLHTVITVKFKDSDATWTLFVELVEAQRDIDSESATGMDSYVVTMVCRRLS